MSTFNSQIFGLVTVSALLVAIIVAFIISPKFRKDVIAGEGEAAVLGIINVKGVIIVLLSALLIGSLLFILRLDAGGNPDLVYDGNESKRVSGELANCSLNVDRDTIFVSVNGTRIGVLDKSNLASLKVSKDRDVEFKWNAQIFDKIKLGEISLAHDTEFIQNTEGDVVSRPFTVKTPYKVSDLDLYFMIDSVQYYLNNEKQGYNYWIQFGEGTNKKNIKWLDEPVSYEKTKNASILPQRSFRCIQHRTWDHMYYIAMGLGQPMSDTSGTLSYKEVQMINLNALEISLN